MKRLGNKGQGMLFVGLVMLISIFAFLVPFILLDHSIKVNVFSLGVTLGANASTISTLSMFWDMTPFLFVGCCFLIMVLYALSRG